MSDAGGDEITIEEFKRVKLVVGKVLEVADHPGADKLCIMKVDTGDRVRQLVAGLKPYMNVEELQGMEVVVVANLRPAVLRGERSEGMLLAALKEGELAVLTTNKPIAAGSIIE